MKFEDLPIRRKLISITMAISGVVLILACASFIIYELVTFRRTMRENLSTLGEVVARNSTGALAFQDQEDAKDTLAALSVENNILAAALYDAHGKLFASYFRNEYQEKLPAKPEPSGYSFDNDSLILFKTVRAETTLGYLYIKSDLRQFDERLRLYAIIVLLILAASTSVAFILSTALQRRISKPILELAGSARKVSEERNYKIRARKYGQDELGQLTDVFNEMLQQIHERDVALREKEERLRLALEASQTAVWNHDLTTGKIMWDEQMQRLFGFRPGEFNGTPAMAALRIHPDDKTLFEETVRMAVQNRHEFLFEFRVIRPDKSLRYIFTRGKGFYDEQDEPQRVAGVALDVTENKEAELALRESEEKYRRLSAELDERVQIRTAELETTNSELEAFTYSVSHDLRAPLRHLTAYSQILLEEHVDQLDPQAKRFLDRIRLGARNMGLLVDDLLNLSRIGRQELKRELTPINSIVDQAIVTLKPEIENREIEWKINPLPIAECDPGLMKQVFVNILSNAVKYTRPREQAVIEVGKLEKEGETIISIRDNGVGFSMAYADKLFGVFQRLHRQEEFEGTGVGLATVQRIIGKHHGRIWADAEENKGATFYFTFPGIQRA